MPLVSPLDLPMLMLLYYFNLNINVLAVADPGFPQGWGANPRGGGGPPTYDLPKFPKNCIELKEFGPPGEGDVRPLCPLRSVID